MADSFKKAREMSRAAKRQTENGSELDEKERVPFAARKPVVEGGENDEIFGRAASKRPHEDGGVMEESGIRPPSKRLPFDEFEDRNVSRWEMSKLQTSLKQSQEQSERWRLEAEQHRTQVETLTVSHAKQVSLYESQLKSHAANHTKPTPPKPDFTALHDLRTELAEKKRLLSSTQQEIDELRANERKLNHQYEAVVEKNSSLESQHKEMQQQLDELQSRMSNNRVEKHSSQEYKTMLEDALQKCKDLESQLASKSHDTKVSQEVALSLREKERENRMLTTENQRLRAKVKACETIEDELAELRSKEARNEKMRDELAQLQSEVLTLKEKDADWVTSLCHLMPPGEKSGPRVVLRLIEGLQSTCQLQKAEHGQLVTLNKQLELRLQHQQERSVSFEAKVKEGEAALEQAQISLEKGRVELSRAVKDKEMYKRFLDSYEAEEKTVKHDEARGQRIEELEKSLLAAQTRANEKETASQVLEMKNRQLEQHLQQVETEAAKMSDALGRGEFNPQNTKVLHMAFNPAKKAVEAKIQAQIDQLTKHCDELKCENEALKLKLSGTSDGPVVIRDQRGAADIAERDQEILRLKKTVADLEIVKERFYKIFHQKAKQFRESCYMLTGFKIEMRQIGGRDGFVLRSMYAEKEDDTLEFFDTGTGLQVMETDFCKRLDKDLVTTCLGKWNSIPAFLSQVTLDLFSKQTKM